MSRNLRLMLALAALIWALAASGFLAFKYAGTTAAIWHWIWFAPILGGLLVALGVAIEHRLGLVLGGIGVLLLAWRGVWLYGYFMGLVYVPAFLLALISLAIGLPRRTAAPRPGG